VNATVSWLKSKTSQQKVLSQLVADYGISRRQAYRYLQQAQTSRRPMPVPETKIVFTVKLSHSLVRQVRRQARRERSTISHWVEEVLRRSLNPRPSHG
jgi:predicted HicB family RNase H-like nuclease